MSCENHFIPAPYIPDTAPFSKEQRAWLNGFLAGYFASTSGTNGPQAATRPKTRLPILFGSQTGTAEQLARRLAAEAGKREFEPSVMEMNSFAAIDLNQEKRLLLVTSTWGDGDPPENAVAFWNFLNSESAPRLDHMEYSVLALGDRNYADFCGAGKKFDARLEQLGAKRVQPCAECDTDYETTACNWMSALWDVLKPEDVPQVTSIHAAAPAPAPPAAYSKTNRFPARLLTNRKLNGPGSAKDTRHFEISLKDSGLHYEVGDALGVMPMNCPQLVSDLLVALRCDGEEAVKTREGIETSLRKGLLENFQITRITPALLKIIATRSGDARLAELLEPANKAALDSFLYGREIIHLLEGHPTANLSAAEFAETLSKLQPRLYSIASSPRRHPGEVHLTVAIVRYESHGRQCKGVCSTFLADRVTGDTPVPVFVQTSPGFRLPQNPDALVIMIGPGTGIAPFRAFLEERQMLGAKGKNWLFFGDQCRGTDFLYREELEAAQRSGHLTRLDVAFSRDQAEKIYVQHRMREQMREFWAWLEGGAHVYVCGDAKRMAKDVEAALAQIIQDVGGKTAEQTGEYIQNLKKERRYQRDVY